MVSTCSPPYRAIGTWTPPSGLRLGAISSDPRALRAGPRADHAAPHRLGGPVMGLRHVVTAATVRTDHSAERAPPRPLAAEPLSEQEVPARCEPPRPTRAPERPLTKPPLHVSLPRGDVELAGGDADPHTFRSESRHSVTALRPLATGASTRREGFRLQAAACWFYPFQRRLGGRGQRIAPAAFDLTLPGPTPASHALGSTFPAQVGTSVTASGGTLRLLSDRSQ